MRDYIDAAAFKEMILCADAALAANTQMINDLNVFPVPDGDTGTNMGLTMNKAAVELRKREFDTVASAADCVASALLRGARGNSGVILSLLFRGIARRLKGIETAGAAEFAGAMQDGVDAAYKAVMKPKEGTILTVARVIAEDALRQAQLAPNDYDALFNVILTSGESILKRTPEMLPVLKQAGVVDAGGRGLLTLYTGYAAALRGEAIEALPAQTHEKPEMEFNDDHDAIGEIKFAYCTEFLIQNLKETAREGDIDTFRRQLNRIGDCVLVVGDLSLVKVHVHTNDPGKALQYGLALGELVNLKIENMVEQRRENQRRKAERTQNAPPKPFGMVSVSLGDGFSKILKDLQVDQVVEGGQTMNPSIEDLQKAIDAVNADTVFVFPNNGNIILAARQAAELSQKDVRVIPTKNVAMGIAAAVAFQPDLSADENAARMEEAAQRVRTGTITYAVRNSEFEDMHISQAILSACIMARWNLRPIMFTTSRFP